MAHSYLPSNMPLPHQPKKYKIGFLLAELPAISLGRDVIMHAAKKSARVLGWVHVEDASQSLIINQANMKPFIQFIISHTAVK